MTEIALIDSLKAGEPMAFERLYDQYWDILYKKTYSRVADEDTAKDIVQDAFITVWQKRKQLVVKTSLEQFLSGVVKFRVLNHFRSERVKQRVLDQAVTSMEMMVLEEPDHISRNEMEESLDKALHDMPKNMKQAILLRCDNLSIGEIAEKLGLAEQTVSNNLYEATQRLRKKLYKQHGELFIGLFLLSTLFNNLFINR